MYISYYWYKIKQNKNINNYIKTITNPKKKIPGDEHGMHLPSEPLFCIKFTLLSLYYLSAITQCHVLSLCTKEVIWSVILCLRTIPCSNHSVQPCVLIQHTLLLPVVYEAAKCIHSILHLRLLFLWLQFLTLSQHAFWAASGRLR